MTSRLLSLVAEGALRWRGRRRTMIGVGLQIVDTGQLYTHLNIKAESGYNPLFQLRSHQEHLPKMTDVFKPLYAGQKAMQERYAVSAELMHLTRSERYEETLT
jgi:hypothetical protein